MKELDWWPCPRGFGVSGRRAICFHGFGEKGHLFSGIWGESITCWGFREQGAEEKHFRELGRKVIFLSGSREQRPPPGAHLRNQWYMRCLSVYNIFGSK